MQWLLKYFSRKKIPRLQTHRPQHGKQSHKIINDLLFYRLICVHCSFIAFLGYVQCIARHTKLRSAAAAESVSCFCCCGEHYQHRNKAQTMQVAQFFVRSADSAAAQLKKKTEEITINKQLNEQRELKLRERMKKDEIQKQI